MAASNIVGAIVNETGIGPAFIGRIRIEREHSTVELPPGMPKAILRDLKRTWVGGRRLAMTCIDSRLSRNLAQRQGTTAGKRRKPAKKLQKGGSRRE